MSATPSPVVRKRWQDAMTKELEEEAAYYERLSSPEKKKYLAELQAATDKFEASRAKKNQRVDQKSETERVKIKAVKTNGSFFSRI